MAEPLSLGHLGRILMRFWALLIIGTILGASAAVGVSFLMTPVYTATATQLVKGLPGTGSAANYEAAQYAVSRAKSYPAFIYSAKVLDGVRSDMRGRESLDDLRRDLSASNPVDTPLLRIAAVGPTPENAQAKANSAARQMALFLVQIETVGGKSPIQIETPVVAALPVDTTSPKRKLMTGVGALAGLAVATLVALILAARRAPEVPTPVAETPPAYAATIPPPEAEPDLDRDTARAPEPVHVSDVDADLDTSPHPDQDLPPDPDQDLPPEPDLDTQPDPDLDPQPEPAASPALESGPDLEEDPEADPERVAVAAEPWPPIMSEYESAGNHSAAEDGLPVDETDPESETHIDTVPGGRREPSIPTQ